MNKERNIISEMIDKYDDIRHRLYLFDKPVQISPLIKEHMMFNEESIQCVNSGNEILYVETTDSKYRHPDLDEYNISKFTNMFVTKYNKERIINLLDILRESGSLYFRISKTDNKYGLLMSWCSYECFNTSERDISFIKKIIDEKINAEPRDDTHTQNFYDLTFPIGNPEYFYHHFEEEVEKMFNLDRYIRSDIEIVCEKAKEIFKYDSEEDIISKPEHYMLSEELEVKDVVELVINNPNSNLNKYQSHMKAVVLEYLMRAENKNGLEDYKKAGQWLVWLIESLEGETK